MADDPDEHDSGWITAVRSALQKYAPEGPAPCPQCKSRNWEVPPCLMVMSEYKKNTALFIGGRAIPVLALTCKQCGYMVTFNAVTLGLVAKGAHNE